MGGTSWFWNGATPERRRIVALVGLVVCVAWLVRDVIGWPIPGSVFVPLFLIAFCVQWRAANRTQARGAAEEN